MKIKSFTISDFKSFHKNGNRINSILDLNYIYGDNNSGKSNLLKFLNLVFSSKVRNSDNIVVEGEVIKKRTKDYFYDGIISDAPYIYHKNNRDVNIEFDFVISLSHSEIKNNNFEFYDELKEHYFVKNRNEMNLHFKGFIKSLGDNTTSEIKLNYVELNKVPILEIEGSDTLYFQNKKEAESLVGNSLHFNTLLSYLNDSTVYIDNNRYFTQEFFDSPKSEKLSPRNFKKWLYSLSINEFEHDKFLKLMEFIRGCNIESLPVLKKLDLSFAVNENKEIVVMLNNGSERLPMDSFGTGVNQIIYILTKLYFTNSRIILIEELELNLSPNTQKVLLNILRKLIEENIIDQVFFTSHSDYFSFRNDISIYETNISLDGISSVQKKGSTSKEFYSRD